MVRVKRKPGEDTGKLISRFKKKMAESGKFDEMRKLEHHTSQAEENKRRRQEHEFRKKLERKRNKR